MRPLLAAPALAGLLALAACGGGAASADGPDRDAFGYRTGSGDARETVALRPAADSTRYLFFPAVIDSVGVRAAGRPAAGDAVAVEVVVQGAFPDACAELSALRQSRLGRFVTVELLMRQPRETVCAAVVRPFRFYVVLDGAYEAGSYTLRLNGRTVPFQVLPALAPDAGLDAG